MKDERLDCTFRRSLFGSGLSVTLRAKDDDDDDIRRTRKGRRREVNGDCRKLRSFMLYPHV